MLTGTSYRSFLFFLILAFISTESYPQNFQLSKPLTPKSKGYAPLNGVKMYYEIYGQGRPLVLLHGSYMNIPLNFGELIPGLETEYQVIAVELQGHGRTADTDRPYSYDLLADDVAGLLKYLKIDSAIVLGYSFGATIALKTAMKYPQMVSKLVFVSSVYAYDGWLPEIRQILKSIVPEFFEQSPLKTLYDSLAPDPAHWKPFVKKLAAFDTVSFNFGDEEVRKIRCATLMIKGDNDGVDLLHTAKMYKLLGGDIPGDLHPLPKSLLAIVPGASHVGLMMETKKLLDIIKPFLAK